MTPTAAPTAAASTPAATVVPRIEVGRDDTGCYVVVEDGFATMKVRGDYDMLRDMLLDAAYSLDPGPDRKKVLNNRIFEACHTVLAKHLSAKVLADQEWTREQVLAAVTGYRIGGMDEWDNGWFPSTIDVQYQFPGDPATKVGEDELNWFTDNDDCANDTLSNLDGDDLKELEGQGHYDRYWSLTVRRPTDS